MARKNTSFKAFAFALIGTLVGGLCLGAISQFRSDKEDKKEETTVETAVDFSIFSDSTKYTSEAISVPDGGAHVAVAGKYVWVPSLISLSNLDIDNNSVVVSGTDEAVDAETLTSNFFFGYSEQYATVLMTRDIPIETDLQYKYYEPGPTVEVPGTIIYFAAGTYNATIKDGFDWEGSFTYTISDETLLVTYNEGFYILTPNA